ncbi:TetR/AcrR family transcriptional regulator [Streptomyces sp. NBC_01198]|uniref:TetR/AcrR family transcriptional regulator n=1 Tax=Streptomyces sp. NBC_01198 TaxID=2903769 RepID=UPI002E0F4B6F|nr:TetR family transcriptional regulator [Streptomyces sp. NBC_01198]
MTGAPAAPGAPHLPEPAPEPDPPPVPERKGERTRRRILQAARTEFGRHGYEKATIRGIALTASVDKASVIGYFGTKEALFREAVHWHARIDELADDDPGRTAEAYLRALLGRWAAEEDSPMSVLLRAGMTSAQAAELLRRHVTSEVVDRVADRIEGPDARLRAAVFAAVMMGIVSQRYLLRLPDLADAPLEDVLRIAVPLVRGVIAPEG